VCRRTADPLDQAADIAGQRRIADQKIGTGNLLLEPFILLPHAAFVFFGRTVAGLDQRLHVDRPDPRRRDGWKESGTAGAAEAGEERTSGKMMDHCGAGSWSRT